MNHFEISCMTFVILTLNSSSVPGLLVSSLGEEQHRILLRVAHIAASCLIEPHIVCIQTITVSIHIIDGDFGTSFIFKTCEPIILSDKNQHHIAFLSSFGLLADILQSCLFTCPSTKSEPFHLTISLRNIRSILACCELY